MRVFLIWLRTKFQLTKTIIRCFTSFLNSCQDSILSFYIIFNFYTIFLFRHKRTRFLYNLGRLPNVIQLYLIYIRRNEIKVKDKWLKLNRHAVKILKNTTKTCINNFLLTLFYRSLHRDYFLSIYFHALLIN